MAKATRPAQILYRTEHKLRKILDDSAELEIKEVEMFGSTFSVPTERKFGSLESVHIYLDRLTGLKSFFAEFGSIPTPQVKEVPKNSAGEWEHPFHRNGTIYLAPHGGGLSSHLREIIVLHELAHHIVEQINSRGSEKIVGGHSSGFLDVYLRLMTIAFDDVMFSNMFRFMLMEEGAKI